MTTDKSGKITAESIVEEHSEYGDAGRIIPTIMLLAGPRIIDLSGLLDLAQVAAVAKIELDTLPRDAETIVLASLN